MANGVSQSAVEPAASFPRWISIFAGLWIVAMSWPVISGLFETWRVSYAETGHGFIAPPLAAYIVWQRRAELAEIPVEGRNWGLAVVLSSSLLLVAAYLTQLVFFSQVALWLILAGSIVFLLGPSWVKALAFPLFLLFLTIPPPAFFYTRLTVEMQLLASRLAELGLEALGYSVLREGNILQMVGERLNVAEACSGIRSLVTLIFFVLVYGYFVVENMKSRWLLVAAAAPIAVLANGLRIIVTGVLSQIDRELARGITHEAAGYVTLFAGGAACILLEQYLFRPRGSAA